MKFVGFKNVNIYSNNTIRTAFKRVIYYTEFIFSVKIVCDNPEPVVSLTRACVSVEAIKENHTRYNNDHLGT